MQHSLLHKPARRLAVPPLLAALIGCALLCPLRQGAAQQPLTEQQRIVHVLNRLGYGPHPGDIERVRAMGIDAYVEQQLYPEGIPDPRAEAKLAGYSILGMSLEQLWDYDRPAAAVGVRRREPVIRKAWTAERLAHGDAAVEIRSTESDSAAPLRRTLTSPHLSPMVTRTNRPEAFEILDTRFVRAVYGERQLLEVLVDFWFNHFNIAVGDPYFITDWTERVIRPHALGKFEDLLVATATHPAMLIYLDNWLSAAPADVIRTRLDAWQPPSGENKALTIRRRMRFFEQTKGLNENYARELMELHTLGVEGGYTQQDVQQVARAFTGWTLTGPREDGAFTYEPLIHEEGDKVVLGRTIKSGGMDEGMQILRLLARHPSTARFVSSKLARRFIADDPPSSVVEAAAETFQETGGDIRAVLRTIFKSPAFFSPALHQAKIKKPLEMVIGALRAVNADIDFSLRPAVVYFDRVMTQMGEPLGRHEAPDGFPDVASAWISTNTLFQRLDFALALTGGQVPGVRVDLEAAERLFQEMGYPEPTAEQLAQARALVARRAARRAGVGTAGMMAEEGMTADTAGASAEALSMYMGMRAAGAAGEARGAPDLQAVAAAVYLGSPRFQKR